MSIERIVLASGNAGKIREFNQMLTDFDVEVLPQDQFLTTEVTETGLTFVENALLKARFASQKSGLPAFADDSGLAVDALKGAPGLYSARFAGIEKNDLANNQLLLEKLQGVPHAQRTARFICVIVLLRHAADPIPLICQGVWEGYVLESPRGDNGFGYDPLFYVPSQQCSAAQLAPEIKNQLSHRGRALRQLREQFEHLAI